jgi:hypothetical protein
MSFVGFLVDILFVTALFLVNISLLVSFAIVFPKTLSHYVFVEIEANWGMEGQNSANANPPEAVTLMRPEDLS